MTSPGNGRPRTDASSAGAPPPGRLRLVDLALVLGFGAGVGLLLVPGLGRGGAPLGERDLGKPAGRSVTADRDFAYSLAEQQLAGERDAAAAAVQPVFDYHPELGTEILGRIHAAFSAARALVAPLALGAPVPTTDTPGDAFERALGVALSPEAAEALASDRFSDEMRAALVFLVGSTLEDPVIEHRSLLNEFPRGIRVRRVSPGADAPREESLTETHAIVGLGEARQALGRKVEVNYGKLPRELRQALVELGGALLGPNLRHNAAETERRRDEARRTIVSRPVPYVRGQVIVREGDIVRPEHVRAVAAMRAEGGASDRVMLAAGVGLFVALLLGVLLRYAAEQMRRLEFRRRDLVALGSLLVLLVGGCRVAAVVFDRFDLARTWVLVLPVAAGAMLARMIAGARVTLLFAVVVALLASLAVGGDAPLVGYYLVAGAAGAIGVRRAQSRRDILGAGLLCGGAAAAAALSLAIYRADPSSIPWAVGLALLGGAFSALATTAMLPVLEYAFDYTTDITLLELANLSHPLLRDLSLRAPGTYHHSMVVGSLAEAACDATGANGLLARVAAYFHDVGKTKNAGYFAENFARGDNPHGRLKASMSALIIRTHVKDSIDLLDEHGLPRTVIETATQHHGTTLIEYFHDKAHTETDADDEVREDDYRYDGRRPQSREAGVLMLADGVEAAVRSIADASEDRLAPVVHRIINKKFADGQLDECDLTLRDLREIARAFLRVLRGIYHGRPAYPWQAAEREKAEAPGAVPGGQPAAGREARSDGGDTSLPRPRPPGADVDVTIEHSAEGRGDVGRLGLD